MSNTQILNRDANGVTFANPTDPDYKVRFKTTSSNKTLNGVTVANFVTEIIINDNVPVVIGGVSANDAVAMRIRFSGSKVAQDRLKAIAASIAGQLPVWLGENVLLGFEPATPPVAIA